MPVERAFGIERLKVAMTVDRPRTLGDLAASGYRIKSVKDEMRHNLVAKLPSGEPLFPGILGYDETVVPQVQNAILSKHDILFLGLRGQAKTRMLRELVRLLDDAIPIVAGSEIHDNPFAPVSKHARDLIASQGDATPIEWIGRDDRYHEKLATPDVTIADLIGEVDMIKHAEGRYLSSELTMHFGVGSPAGKPWNLLHQRAARSGAQDPGRVVQRARRARRPDSRIPCTAGPGSLHGFLGQPRGLRTNRGRIVHAAQGPGSVRSSARTTRSRERSAFRSATRTPGWIAIRAARTACSCRASSKSWSRKCALARTSPHVNQQSGVSVRMSIANLENVVSNAERRAIIHDERWIVPRPSDLAFAVPSLERKTRAHNDRGRRTRRQAHRASLRRIRSATFSPAHFDIRELRPVVDYFENGQGKR